MGKREGGIAQKEKPIITDIPTHPIIATEIAQYLKPHYEHLKKGVILDACAGAVTLGNTFFNELPKSFLLTYQDIKISGKSILDFSPDEKYNIIVCNPPWHPVTLALQIWHKLYSLLADGGVMFYIINNTFCYQGAARAVNLNYQKFYFLPRFVYKSAGRPLLDCGVMVTHRASLPAQAAQLRPFIPVSRLQEGEPWEPNEFHFLEIPDEQKERRR